MSPHQSENPDPYQDRRPPERQPRQGANPPQSTGAQGGGPQGPPPEQFRGQGSPQPGQTGPQGAPAGGQQQSTGSAPAGQPAQQRQTQQQQQPVQQRPVQQQRTQQQPAQQGAMSPQAGMAQGVPVQQGGPAAGQGGMQGPQVRSAPIDEVLQSDVVTVRPDAALTEVVEKMANEDVGSVIVVEEEKPVGIVTDRKVALALRETTDLSEATARDFVSSDLVTGTTEMTVFDILGRLEDAGIRRLPIVDEDEALQGIVTLDDVVVLLNAELSNVASIIQSQSPRF